MQAEVYSATVLGVKTSVNAAAKAALPGPQTKENILQVRADLIALVAQGKVVFQDNAHLLLGLPNSQTVFVPNGVAPATAYHTLDSVLLVATKLI